MSDISHYKFDSDISEELGNIPILPRSMTVDELIKDAKNPTLTIHPNAYIIVIPRNDSSMNAIDIRINLPNIEKIDEFLQ